MAHEIADGVPPRQCAGAREIGFTIPERYNASRVLFDNLAKGYGEQAGADRPCGHAQLCASFARRPAAGATALSRSA